MMMEETDHVHAIDSPYSDSKSFISDALQDAAQTYTVDALTAPQSEIDYQSIQSDDGQQEVGIVAPVSQPFVPFIGVSAGPAPLPPVFNFSELSIASSTVPSQTMAGLVPPSEITLPSFPGVSTSDGSYASSSVSMGASPGRPVLPPPPTMGFVPAHGIVSANPSKLYNVGPVMQDSSVNQIFTPSSVPKVEQLVYGGHGASSIQSSMPENYGQGPATNHPYEMTSPVYQSYVPAEREPVSPQKPEGFFGWLPGSGLMHKVLEKTKSSVESVITTLDPGMKEVIYSGGLINVVVTSSKEVKVGAVREAFQKVFGRATVIGIESQPTIAPQPVGYSSGVRGAEERIDNLRQSGVVDENQVLVSVENFIVELLPDRWFDIGCVVLKDPRHNIELTTFSQATPVSAEYICAVQDATPADYPLRWSGFAMTVGQAVQRQQPHVDHSDWHAHFTGVSRREMLFTAARSIAGLYQSSLASVQRAF